MIVRPFQIDPLLRALDAALAFLGPPGGGWRACDEMRSAIVSVDHAPTEMVLIRQCADVSKLVYHMRINGDLLDQDLLAAFVGQMCTTGVTCCGSRMESALKKESLQWTQAHLCI